MNRLHAGASSRMAGAAPRPAGCGKFNNCHGPAAVSGRRRPAPAKPGGPPRRPGPPLGIARQLCFATTILIFFYPFPIFFVHGKQWAFTVFLRLVLYVNSVSWTRPYTVDKWCMDRGRIGHFLARNEYRMQVASYRSSCRRRQPDTEPMPVLGTQTMCKHSRLPDCP